eukprot:15435022-Alexandrium_andersonii.AAC.1
MSTRVLATDRRLAHAQCRTQCCVIIVVHGCGAVGWRAAHCCSRRLQRLLADGAEVVSDYSGMRCFEYALAGGAV